MRNTIHAVFSNSGHTGKHRGLVLALSWSSALSLNALGRRLLSWVPHGGLVPSSPHSIF